MNSRLREPREMAKGIVTPATNPVAPEKELDTALLVLVHDVRHLQKFSASVAKQIEALAARYGIVLAA
jgi:hypothetical protein